MPSLRDIRKAVAEVLSALEGVNVHPLAIETVTAPAIEIVPVIGSNRAFNRGVVEWDLMLIVTTRGESAQDQLDDLISGTTKSIPAIIHASPTAGQNQAEQIGADGVVFTISDQGVTDYGAEIVADNVRSWKARYMIRVMAKGAD